MINIILQSEKGDYEEMMCTLYTPNVVVLMTLAFTLLCVDQSAAVNTVPVCIHSFFFLFSC